VVQHVQLEGGEDALVWPAGSSRAGEAWNTRMRIGAYIGLHWIAMEDEGTAM
jgi:hypothetical protein